MSSSNGEAECVKTKTGIFSQSYIFTEFNTISKLQLSAKKKKCPQKTNWTTLTSIRNTFTKDARDPFIPVPYLYPVELPV